MFLKDTKIPHIIKEKSVTFGYNKRRLLDDNKPYKQI